MYSKSVHTYSKLIHTYRKPHPGATQSITHALIPVLAPQRFLFPSNQDVVCTETDWRLQTRLLNSSQPRQISSMNMQVLTPRVGGRYWLGWWGL